MDASSTITASLWHQDKIIDLNKFLTLAMLPPQIITLNAHAQSTKVELESFFLMKNHAVNQLFMPCLIRYSLCSHPKNQSTCTFVTCSLNNILSSPISSANTYVQSTPKTPTYQIIVHVLGFWNNISIYALLLASTTNQYMQPYNSSIARHTNGGQPYNNSNALPAYYTQSTRTEFPPIASDWLRRWQIELVSWFQP